MLNRLFRRAYKKSYSQCGEDLIIAQAFRILGIGHPTYADVGANTPIAKNNTYLFYSQGSSGVCIEPNPELASEIRRARPHDTVLNIGIGPVQAAGADYYVMTSKALNTFSKADAEAYVKDGNYGTQRIEQVLSVPLRTLDSVLAEHFPHGVDLLSVDTEGYDLEILRSANLDTPSKPKIICVETARYSGNEMQKDDAIISLLRGHGYMLYGDTFINSIFIDTNLWDKQRAGSRAK